MPSLAPRLAGDSSSTGIQGSAIALIVVFGIVPVFVLIWVVSWLFWCYPYNRSCCCTRRKKKAVEPEVGGYKDSTITSQETLREKNFALPDRPFTAQRNESGSSSNGRLSKADPRMSLQTVNSDTNVHVSHQPQRFV